MIKSQEMIDTIQECSDKETLKFIRRRKEVKVFGIRVFYKTTFPIILQKIGTKWENLYL
jgi:hypothetical protein